MPNENKNLQEEKLPTDPAVAEDEEPDAEDEENSEDIEDTEADPSEDEAEIGQSDIKTADTDDEDDADLDDLWDDWDDSEDEPTETEIEPEKETVTETETESEPPMDEKDKLLDRLLTDLGYEGTAKEKLAKYKAENGIKDEKKEQPTTEQKDLEARAKTDFETIAKAYPDRMKGIKRLQDIPEFDAVIRKMVADGCSMLEAYNEVVVGNVPSAKAEKAKAREQSKSHLIGTQTTVKSSRYEPDTAEMRELRRNFPQYSEEQIRKLYRKVQQNTH